MAEEITTREIFDTLVGFAKSTEENFVIVKADISDLKTDVGVLKTDVAVLKISVEKLETNVTRIDSQMVTKHYLDDKLANLRGELIQIIDRKIQLARI
ncbi:hypothetical protein HQ524_02540 [Candidatus Uhrbacteria bacterium]|nr:hypothetical protein [Candidatus Uhrbacteria bacterium]